MRNVMIFVISLLCIFSLSSYEAYGYRINDMVTMNLPHDNLTSTVQLLYCLGLLGSYPIQVIPAFDIVESSKCFEKFPSIFGEKLRWLNTLVLRTIIVIATGYSATVIPKFGLFINLTGAFACTALAFIIPVMMYQRLFLD
jgi:proton-coupled amino acid transporter